MAKHPKTTENGNMKVEVRTALKVLSDTDPVKTAALGEQMSKDISAAQVEWRRLADALISSPGTNFTVEATLIMYAAFMCCSRANVSQEMFMEICEGAFELGREKAKTS